MWADGAERTRLFGVFDEQCRGPSARRQTVMSPVDKGRGDVARARRRCARWGTFARATA